MRPVVFVDTNVLLYLISADTDKAARAEAVLIPGVVVSVQVLNEFAHVARRKAGLAWPELGPMLDDICSFATVVDLTLAIHRQGLVLAQRHQLSVYDAMIAAAALDAGCDTLLSEDFQDGQVFDGRLRIKNPFR